MSDIYWPFAASCLRAQAYLVVHFSKVVSGVFGLFPIISYNSFFKPCVHLKPKPEFHFYLLWQQIPGQEQETNKPTDNGISTYTLNVKPVPPSASPFKITSTAINQSLYFFPSQVKPVRVASHSFIIPHLLRSHAQTIWALQGRRYDTSSTENSNLGLSHTGIQIYHCLTCPKCLL